MSIITRFPPSPTGWFHIGNARTAIFNYLYTKNVGGKMLFRLEDTDTERSKDEYAEDIIDGLKWLKIDIDLSSPYKQSEHGETYKKYLQKLIDEEKAYISKETPKEEGDRAEVIRLKNPGKKIVFNDLVRGEVAIDTTELGDFVIAKSITEPIYHFAVVVDDFEMGVTHIMRGEDGIYNTPRQILIQEAIGAPRPTYAHVPFILNEDRSKLSKRKQGEKVSLKYYREQGFLPEAMLNFLAFIGWNPGGDIEMMSLDEMIKAFSVDRIQKSGAIFNNEKLLWYNREYIKKLPKNIAEREVLQRLPAEYRELEISRKILPQILDRISVWSDVTKMFADGEFDYCYNEPRYEPSILVWKKSNADETKIILNEVLQIIKNINSVDFDNVEKLKEAIMPYAEKIGRGNVLWPIRVALSGKEKSPDPFTLLSILGAELSLKRIQYASDSLS